MGLLRSGRGPYAPRRQPVAVDWNKEFAGVNAMRAQVAAVDERARADAMRHREESDPLGQLVKRCHSIEQEQAELRTILQRQAEQLTVIIEQLGGDGS